MKLSFGFTISLVLIASVQGAPEPWYTFEPSHQHTRDSAISMHDWSPDPAGAHGRISREGDKLLYQGREIKIWGVNNTYAQAAPEKPLAQSRADFYAKFGFNAVRLHKFADGDGSQGCLRPGSSVEFDAAKLDRMDHFISALKARGIFIKLSPNFGIKVGRDHYGDLPYMAELGDLTQPRIRADHGMIYLADELQAIQIAQTLSLLNHRNPYTGTRYADEPAIFCLELFNEDSALFFGTNRSLQQSPTIRQRTAVRFTQFLQERYGTEAAWRAAWGDDAIIANPQEMPGGGLRELAIGKDALMGSLVPETFAARSIVPWGTPWYYDEAVTPGSASAHLRQRMLDTMSFLIGLQDRFYDTYAEAIRGAGYSGEIVGSNWHAGSLVSHVLNLASDRRVGMIDRHNYFGGGSRVPLGQPFKDGSMLAVPGSGMLSTGMQQVDDRPFMLSEWIHVSPSEWMAEGPAILGAYGWGLNGWDASFAFQNGDTGTFSATVGRWPWDATHPAFLAACAAVARQVRRMDVMESPTTLALNVHLPSLKEGRMSFRGETLQANDRKSLTSDRIPMRMLATGRVAIRFNDRWQETEPAIVDQGPDDAVITSGTGQLRWRPAPPGTMIGGQFTINTAATKAFVGFSDGDRTFDLGDGFTLKPAKGFSVIYLTAKGSSETIEDADEIVVVAVARSRNTGMRFNDEGNILLDRGTAPILMEPVRATATLPFAGTLQVLDHDGHRAVSQRPAPHAVEIDGSADKTPFYLLRRDR